KRVETVGRVQPHVQAKLVDKTGGVVPVGTPGEICVAGYLLQKGFVCLRYTKADWFIRFYHRYWGDEDQTRAVMRRDADGTLWMHTGDEGVMDEEGYLRSKFFFFSLSCGSL